MKQGLHSTRTQLVSNMNNMPTDDSYCRHYPSYHEPYPSYNSPLDLDINKTREEYRVPKKRNAADELSQTLRDAFEIVNMTKQARPTFSQTPVMGAGIPWSLSNFFMPPLFSNTRSKNIIGYQGGICEICFSWFIYDVSNKQKMRPRIKRSLLTHVMLKISLKPNLSLIFKVR